MLSTYTIGISKEIKEKMKQTDLFWSEEIRSFITPIKQIPELISTLLVKNINGVLQVSDL